MTDTAEKISVESSATELTIALAGNPNVGKTTLFNALTGLKQKVANYPGVTVEKKTGRCNLHAARRSSVAADSNDAGTALVIDLPGTYSLASRSPDEHVARQVVRGQIAGTPRPDVIIVVCDASNLERNLFLVTQVLELGRPAVVALTMTDLAQKAHRPINVEKLAAHLRVPVVAVQANKGIGIGELKRAVLSVAGRKAQRLELPLPDIMETHVDRLRKILQEKDVSIGHAPDFDQAAFDAHLLLSTGDDEEMPDPRRQHPRVRAEMAAAMDAMTAADIDPVAAEIEAHYSYITSIAADVVVEEAGAKASDGPPATHGQTTATDRIDRILTHRVWGMAIFVGLMGLVFWSIFSWADPIMKFLQDTVVGGLGNWIGAHMADGALKDLLVSGIVGGVGNVVVFLPQIALLFLFLAILEDSGYMSRAAFLMDRIMSRVGLHGKSFIPLLSGFACAVPAIMGTRVIENRRDRLATILILPLMSCSARLPVYSLMIATFFAGTGWLAGVKQAGIMLTMYALGTLTAFGLAFIFKRTLLRGPAPAFILEMPPYRMPKPKTVLVTVSQRSWQFLKRAGTLIFAFSVMMWAATSYPKPTTYSQDFAGQIASQTTVLETLQKQTPANDEQIANQKAKIGDLQNAQRAEDLEYSVAGRVGRFIAPAFAPMGLDWKLSIGVTGAFFAREVIVSTMGIVYSVGDADETSTALQDQMRHAYTPLTAIALMVFVVYCMQCLSTLAIVKRETGQWKWPIFMFVYMTGLAYAAAVVVYQGGRLMGFA